MPRSEDDDPEPLNPEELDDEAWDNLLDAVERAAERRHLDERARLVTAGVIDVQGRLMKERDAQNDGDEGGGW
jgi:hypothetical protein